MLVFSDVEEELAAELVSLAQRCVAKKRIADTAKPAFVNGVFSGRRPLSVWIAGVNVRAAVSASAAISANWRDGARSPRRNLDV